MSPSEVGVKRNLVKINPKVLEWARRRAYFSESFIASRIGVSVQKYREWESGLSYPTRNELFKIALVLKCPTTIFLCLGFMNT